MQIDLANTLVLKAYFCLLCIVHHCPQARAPLPWEGLGVGFLPSFGGVGRGFWLGFWLGFFSSFILAV